MTRIVGFEKTHGGDDRLPQGKTAVKTRVLAHCLRGTRASLREKERCYPCGMIAAPTASNKRPRQLARGLLIAFAIIMSRVVSGLACSKRVNSRPR